jgi:tetratricopeptide (TPR) repeat protein
MIIDKYPEFIQSYTSLAQAYKKRGDTAAANDLLNKMEAAQQHFFEKNPDNLMYMQDLGVAKYYNGKVQEGLDLLWEAFRANPNSNYAYQKLIQVLYELRRSNDIIRATQMYSDYKINRSDPIVQQIMEQMQSAPTMPPQKMEP